MHHDIPASSGSTTSWFLGSVGSLGSGWLAFAANLPASAWLAVFGTVGSVVISVVKILKDRESALLRAELAAMHREATRLALDAAQDHSAGLARETDLARQRDGIAGERDTLLELLRADRAPFPPAEAATDSPTD